MPSHACIISCDASVGSDEFSDVNISVGADISPRSTPLVLIKDMVRKYEYQQQDAESCSI